MPKKTLTKRVNTLERKVKYNKPEEKMKNYVFNSSVPTKAMQTILLNDLVQGTSMSQRIGNQVKITKVEMSVSDSWPDLDFQLILVSDTGDIPVYADFEDTVFGRLRPLDTNRAKEIWNSVDFLSSTGLGGSYTRFFARHKFRYPLRTLYDGTVNNTVSKNALYLVIKNGSTTNVTALQGMVRVYYTDA